jgi:hypothetical protein
MQLKDDLVARARMDTERDYLAALERYFEQRLGQYGTAAARSERATEVALKKLERTGPRAGAVAEHKAVVVAFREHLAIARELHAASQAADADRSATAVTGWQSSIGNLRRAEIALAERLDHSQRWPSPPSPITTSEHRRQ